MELVTASDLFVTASVALLLSLLVAKLVSMAMATDQHVVTLKQELLTVQKPQSESRVEFLSPIQVSTNVETEQNREEEEEEEEKVQSNVVAELAVTPNISVYEVEAFNDGMLREEHVAEEEEEEVKEKINEEREQLVPHSIEQGKTDFVEDCEEQGKTVCVEDCEEQRKTEEIAAEPFNDDDDGDDDYSEQQRKTECVEDCEEHRETEEIAAEPFNDDDDGDDYSEQQRKTECVEDCVEQGKTECIEDCEEQGETEEITLKPFNDDDDDDDDWEGIERSELEKEFMSATEFVGGKGSDGLGSDVQMELYALHKVATEGPCREPQPMPLKFSARAKWNAWQKLGNMSPEVAMEQYISLLSDKVPGWMKDTSAGMSEHEPKGSEEVSASESAASDVSISLSHQQIIITERELEQEAGAQDHSTRTDLENNVKK